MSAISNKLYLHPVKSPQRLKTSQFQKVSTSSTSTGARITQIESSHPAVAHAYRHGLLVEGPKGSKVPPYIVYGSYEEISSVALNLKKDPDKVIAQVRPLGTLTAEQNEFYLNAPPPPKKLQSIPPEQLENIAAAHKMFPDQGKENRPLTRTQEEKADLKEHLQSVMPAPPTAAPEAPPTTLATAPSAPSDSAAPAAQGV